MAVEWRVAFVVFVLFQSVGKLRAQVVVQMTTQPLMTEGARERSKQFVENMEDLHEHPAHQVDDEQSRVAIHLVNDGKAGEQPKEEDPIEEEKQSEHSGFSSNLHPCQTNAKLKESLK